MDIFDEQLLTLVSNIFKAERVGYNPIARRIVFKNCTIVKPIGEFKTGDCVERIRFNFKPKKNGWYAEIGDCKTHFRFCADWGGNEINDVVRP